MLRSGHAASVARSSLRSLTKPTTRTTASFASKQKHGILQAPSRITQVKKPMILALTDYKPLSTSLTRHRDSPYDKIDKKHEDALEHETMKPHPEEVSTASTVHEVFHEKGVEEPEKDEDMLAGVWSDWKTVKETFALDEVPREALVVGMAGVLPYLATSVTTAYLAWDINHADLTGSSFLVSGPTAELLLHIIEPLQIGYGAVIISFIGAIHWGLEWARYGGVYGYPRYAIGVIAPAVAWPTILMPIEYALITQFCAFTFLYFADARAVVRGWAPAWYSTYRFVLTFVVGVAIVVSLIGRGQIADKINRLPSPADRVKHLREQQLDAIEQEERYKQQMLVAKDEAGDDEDEEDGEDEDDE